MSVYIVKYCHSAPNIILVIFSKYQDFYKCADSRRLWMVSSHKGRCSI